MTHRPTAVERAFELARSGSYPTVDAIRRRLRAEGYGAEQISGPSLLRQLRQIQRDASKPTP